MPKKVRTNIRNKADYNNCKKTRSIDKHRIKNFEFRKRINDSTKWAQKFRLKLKKEDKLSILTDFHGFISNVNGKIPKKPVDKLNKRPLKCLNMNNSWSNKKFTNNNNNNNNKAMAVDIDHLYLNCGDSKMSIGRQIELQKQLKELNCLHLELMQQQAEELLAKDKIIIALKQENENLRARLERIERRVSLNLQKKPNEFSPISVDTNFHNDTSYNYNIKSEISPRSFSPRSPGRSTINKNIVEKWQNNKMESTLLTVRKEIDGKKSPRQTTNDISPRERRLRKDSIRDQESPSSVRYEDYLRKTRSPIYKNSIVDEALSNKKYKSGDIGERERKQLLLLPSTGEENEGGLTDHSLRSRERPLDGSLHSELSSNSLLETSMPISYNETEPNQSIFQHIDSLGNLKSLPKEAETRKVRSEGILITNDSYYLPSHSSIDFSEILDEDGIQTHVEIPKWGIKHFTTLYVMEGTENLEDEIFAKRHAKPEHDERRRKRWDMQRMREQRNYEKLRERYEGRNSANDGSGKHQQSLWPKPENTQSIIVDNSLPVCAFGQPLAQISESDFFVPWLSGKMPQQVAPLSKKKKPLH